MGYKFVYFDLRGRGEAIRYLLNDNKIDFEELLLDMDTFKNEWKPKLPYGQLPCLMDGDFQIVQFNTILRHLGRKHNLYGEGVEDAAKMDMITDGIEDLRTKYTAMIYGNYENGKQAYIDALPQHLECFEKILSANDAAKTGCCVGSKMSFADYDLFDILDIHLVLSATCLDSFPTLSAFHKAVLDRPNIQAHRQTDNFKAKTINYGPNC